MTSIRDLFVIRWSCLSIYHHSMAISPINRSSVNHRVLSSTINLLSLCPILADTLSTLIETTHFCQTEFQFIRII